MHIFYCAGGKFGEIAGVFLAEQHPPDAGLEAPDAVSVCPVCRQCLAQLGLGTRRRLDPVGASGVLSPVFCIFAILSGYETGEHRTVRCSASGDPASLQTSLSFSPVSTRRVRWQLNRIRCSAGDR